MTGSEEGREGECVCVRERKRESRREGKGEGG